MKWKIQRFTDAFTLADWGIIEEYVEPPGPPLPPEEPILIETYKYIQIWKMESTGIYYVVLGDEQAQFPSLTAARIAIDTFLAVPTLIETYRSIAIWLDPDGSYTFSYEGVLNRWQTLAQAKAQIDKYLEVIPGEAKRVNPLPWSGWTYWHNTWVQEHHSFDPTQATIGANDIGNVPGSGLSLAILRQELDIPLKGHDYWLRFTVGCRTVENPQNWLRAAMVARIDRLSGGESDSRYTEYDFYQGMNTTPHAGGNFKWILVDRQDPTGAFHTYKVHLTKDLIDHWGLTLHDSYRLNYLAPTIEMRNSGMTVIIQDVELWEGDPSPGE